LANAGVFQNFVAGATAELINSGALPEKIITRATGDGVIAITTNQGCVMDSADKINGGFAGGTIDQFAREIVVQDGRGTSRARCTKGGVGDQVGEQFAFVAGALQAWVEARIQGVAAFLQEHDRELLEAEVACIDLVGIDIENLVAIGPHLGIGTDSALHLDVFAQVDRDPQAGCADRLQQRLLVGLKHRGLGAGPAEHIVQQGVAIGSGE